MTLLDRIADRRAGLVEAERLCKQLAEVEDELERVTVAEQVVVQLIDEAVRDGEELDDRVGGVRYLVAARSGGRPVRVMIPHGDGAPRADL